MAELRAGCQAMIIGGFYRTNDGKAVLVAGFVPNGSRFTGMERCTPSRCLWEMHGWYQATWWREMALLERRKGWISR